MKDRMEYYDNTNGRGPRIEEAFEPPEPQIPTWYGLVCAIGTVLITLGCIYAGFIYFLRTLAEKVVL